MQSGVRVCGAFAVLRLGAWDQATAAAQLFAVE